MTKPLLSIAGYGQSDEVDNKNYFVGPGPNDGTYSLFPDPARGNNQRRITYGRIIMPIIRTGPVEPDRFPLTIGGMLDRALLEESQRLAARAANEKAAANKTPLSRKERRQAERDAAKQHKALDRLMAQATPDQIKEAMDIAEANLARENNK